MRALANELLGKLVGVLVLIFVGACGAEVAEPNRDATVDVDMVADGGSTRDTTLDGATNDSTTIDATGHDSTATDDANVDRSDGSADANRNVSEGGTSDASGGDASLGSAWVEAPRLSWALSSRVYNLCLSGDGRTLGYALEPSRFEVRQWTNGAWERIWFADRVFGGTRETLIKCAFSGDGSQLVLALDEHAQVMTRERDNSFRVLAAFYAEQTGDKFASVQFARDHRTVAFQMQRGSQTLLRYRQVFHDINGAWQNWVRAEIRYPTGFTENPFVTGFSMSLDGQKILVATADSAMLFEHARQVWTGRVVSACISGNCAFDADGTTATSCVQDRPAGHHDCESRNMAGAVTRTIRVFDSNLANFGPDTRAEGLRVGWRGEDAFFGTNVTRFVSNTMQWQTGLVVFHQRNGVVQRFGRGGSAGGGAAVSDDGNVVVVSNTAAAALETFVR